MYETNVTVIVKDPTCPDSDEEESPKEFFERIIIQQANRIIYQLQKVADEIMLNLDALNSAVANETTVDQSVITLLNGLSAQLSDALAGDAVDQAAVQSVVDQINSNASAIAEAVAKNTPAAAEEPAPEPAPEQPVGETPPADANPPLQGFATGGDAAPV